MQSFSFAASSIHRCDGAGLDQELMQDYFIGELDLDETFDILEIEVIRKEQEMDIASKVVAYAVQYWAILVAAVDIKLSLTCMNLILFASPIFCLDCI